jgi:hypothetical protein
LFYLQTLNRNQRAASRARNNQEYRIGFAVPVFVLAFDRDGLLLYWARTTTDREHLKIFTTRSQYCELLRNEAARVPSAREMK